MNSDDIEPDADSPSNPADFVRQYIPEPGFWAGLTIAIGCIGLSGWFLDIPGLISIIPSGYRASPNTLFLFIIIGLNILLPYRRTTEKSGVLLTMFLIGIVYSIVLWTEVDILLGYQIRIDTIIASTQEMAGAIPHGIMSPITATLFLILGAGILGVYKYPRHSAYTGVLVLSVSCVIIIGYLYEAPLLYAGHLAPVSLISAIAFITSAIALILRTGEFHTVLGLDATTSVYHQIIRLFIPFIVIILVLEGWVITILFNETGSNLVLVVALITILCICITVLISRYFSRIISIRLDKAERIRKRAEDALSDSLTRIKIAVDNAEVGFWSWDFITDMLSWDEKTYEMHHLDPGTPITFHSWLSIIHPDSTLSADEIQGMKEQDEIHTEFKILLPDSTLKYFEGHGKVLVSENGVPERMVGITWDVTSRIETMQALHKKNEELAAVNEELAAQEEELRVQYLDLAKANDEILNYQKFTEEVIYQAGEGIIVTDTKGFIKIWNHLMEKYSGIPYDSIIGSEIFGYLPEMVKTQFTQYIRDALSGEQVKTSDLFFSLPRTEKSGWFTATCAPHHDNEGNIIGSIITIKDIIGVTQLTFIIERSIYINNANNIRACI